ncbi:ROK family protein [Flavobacterium aquicola]|uniref:Glucokinase n=1 Tax=Flavobacterium aquicola TaxID=1682742 RepID=A0A3E0ECQ6_9FLAO|nr:ROK family protein [Flavobacterium aquicola]REG94786.1 glucokinase [Flavobacterium aquicola]
MKDSYNIGVDVGGSHISCAYVHKSTGKIVEGSFAERKIDSNGNIQEFMQSLRLLFGQLFSVASPDSFSGVGIAMPGPFDYENGISKIRGVQKFEALYDINLKQVFKEVIGKEDISVCFTNDASCYALGEYYAGAAQNSKRTIVVTLGTGFGSTFLINGITQSIAGNGVPPEGYLYNVPFKESIADDYFSTRWFVNTCKERYDLDVSGARETAELAKKNDSKALAVFEEFAENLTEMIFPWIDQFKPDTFVIGGSIAKAFPFFLENLNNKLVKKGVKNLKTTTCELWDGAPIVGAAMTM